MVAMVGAAGSVSQLLWAQLHALDDEVERVGDDSNLAPTVGGGTREAVTAAGIVRCCGCYADLGAATVSLAANGGANARKDYRVAEYNWHATVASPLGTPARSVEIKTVQGGGGGTVPALTKTSGVLYQVALGLYTVPTGGGAVTVEDVRPQRRRAIVYKTNIDIISISGSAALERLVATIDIPDPGWPEGWKAEMFGAVNFQSVSAGRGLVYGYLDDDLLTSGRAPNENAGVAHLRAEATQTARTGSAVAKLKIQPNNISGEQLTTLASHSGFTVVVLPA